MAKDLNKIKKYYDSERGSREQYMYNYYTGKSVPVFDRTPVSALKAASHTNIHEDFFKDIIDLKTSYMGQKIKIAYSGDNEFVDEMLKLDAIVNNTQILNSDLVRKTSITGIASRLVYTENGKIKYKNIGKDVGTVIYDYEKSPFDPDAAYFYYTTVDIEGKKVQHCDVYDSTTVTYYESTMSQDTPDGYAGPDNISNSYTYIQKGEPQLHNFNQVPLIPFINNDMWLGDCDKVVGAENDTSHGGLMDVYDEILSDTAAEVKAMRLAYLKVHGNIYTGTDDEGNPIDINKWLTQTSTMRFPIDEDGKGIGDAQFLEKNIQDEVIENQLNRLRTGIYEKSGSIDIKQISDSVSDRVIGIKAQLMRLENTASTTESYVRAGLYKQLELIAYWLKEFYNITVAMTDFVIEFERVFPDDNQSAAEIASVLSAIMSKEDAFKNAGYDDYEAIAERAGGITAPVAPVIAEELNNSEETE